MADHSVTSGRLGHWIHQHFLWLMVGSYAIAACVPAPGLWIREVAWHVAFPGFGTMKVSLSMLMLSALLLNAGLGVDIAHLRKLARNPWPLCVGLLANLVIPVVFIFAVTRAMGSWHNADEVQSILVGLALVGSMPIAGSSTAWAQNADGELALSLGLVLFSTLLSPLTTPLALHSVGLMASGEYATDLHELAGGGTGMFLTLCVLAPSLIGIALRPAIGPKRIAAAKPRLKLLNSLVLLTLNYSNASVSLPQIFGDFDADFLAITLGIVTTLCVLTFTAGGVISRVLKGSPAERASLMFGLGMNNNGTGMVLASLTLAHHPRVMLPIIFYNLVQHLVAGLVDRRFTPNARPGHQAPEGIRQDRLHDKAVHPSMPGYLEAATGR